ncbi:hypothetical protein D9611_004416 [Ephemerocybe angulata]|uniref:HAT C-terminal dimerisation domain-containing protein n=1 Tax=Ephemerocybe angulata TaxID=980116 RepID=A0A8H5F5R1_9AGAR|nr:hypothetical protein D9611_004416 [Tulosesus angulatus]
MPPSNNINHLPDQCARGLDGKLLDASEIEFRFDPDDETPLPRVKPAARRTVPQIQPTLAQNRARRAAAGSSMGHILASEKRDPNGNLENKYQDRQPSTRTRRPGKGRRQREATDDANTDMEDGDYEGEPGASGDESSGESDSESVVELSEQEVGNDELADILPAKTNPKGSTKRKAPSSFFQPAQPKKTRLDNTTPLPLGPAASTSSVASTSSNTPSPLPRTKTQNPIYLFFKTVSQDSNGKSEPGSKYYECYHGNRRIFKITPKMKHNTKHMVEHLQKTFPVFYQLYLVLKARPSPPTPEEIAVASGASKLSPAQLKEYSKNLESRSGNIIEAFDKQTKAAWDQAKFDGLVVKWVVTTDQSFDAVDKESFRDMVTCAHGSEVKIIHRSTVARRVLKLGEDTIEETREMFQLLEGIGAISKSDRDAAETSGYQVNVVPSEAEVDDQEEDNDFDLNGELDEDAELPGLNFGAIHKVRKISRGVRSSPQRREAWMKEATSMVQGYRLNPDSAPANAPKNPLMLILDVSTRWGSSHAMLERFLQFRPAISQFTAKHKDFWQYDLTQSEWHTIETVCEWLQLFKIATQQMSTTSSPMLSSTIAVFRVLQGKLKDILRHLPNDFPSTVKTALINAHKKLSDYYFRFDESRYGTWAALLDPRISYQGLRSSFSDDPSLLTFLDDSRLKLENHYHDMYEPFLPSHPPPTTSTTHTPSFAFDFMAAFQQAPAPTSSEIDSYFRLPIEDFRTCDPVQWWHKQRFQFPRLYKLARDILSIPGSAVAVERIFSGGRDTISLRRASLRPKTIRMLMISKQRYRRERRLASK